MKIIKSFLSYYDNPSEKNAIELFYEIENYNFENYEDFINQLDFKNIKPKKKYVLKKLFSNKRTSYYFGPNFEFWKEKIDSWKTFSEKKDPIIFIKDKFPWDTKINTFTDTERYGYSNFIILDFAKYQKRSFDFLVDTINKVYNKHGPVSIHSMPLRFLFLFSFNEITEFLTKSKKIKSITSMDCEPFYKKKKLQKEIHVNDQMMDWKSGVCFRTCKCGQIHFLPTFKIEGNKVTNLINLFENKNNNLDDHVYIEKNRKLCGCGKYYLPINFVPHKKTQPTIENKFLYDLEMVESLNSNFLNIQFLQRGNIINVLYDCIGNINHEDILTIERFLKKNHYDNNVNFIKKNFRIGSKFPTYFRIKNKFL